MSSSDAASGEALAGLRAGAARRLVAALDEADRRWLDSQPGWAWSVASAREQLAGGRHAAVCGVLLRAGRGTVDASVRQLTRDVLEQAPVRLAVDLWMAVGHHTWDAAVLLRREGGRALAGADLRADEAVLLSRAASLMALPVRPPLGDVGETDLPFELAGWERPLPFPGGPTTSVDATTSGLRLDDHGWVAADLPAALPPARSWTRDDTPGPGAAAPDPVAQALASRSGASPGAPAVLVALRGTAEQAAAAAFERSGTRGGVHRVAARDVLDALQWWDLSGAATMAVSDPWRVRALGWSLARALTGDRLPGLAALDSLQWRALSASPVPGGDYLQLGVAVAAPDGRAWAAIWTSHGE